MCIHCCQSFQHVVGTELECFFVCYYITLFSQKRGKNDDLIYFCHDPPTVPALNKINNNFIRSTCHQGAKDVLENIFVLGEIKAMAMFYFQILSKSNNNLSAFLIAVFASFTLEKLSCVEQQRKGEREGTMRVMVKRVMMVIEKNEEEHQVQIPRKVINQIIILRVQCTFCVIEVQSGGKPRFALSL